MADIQHSSLTGSELHQPGYIQSADPGAVGAGILWIDTTLGTGLWVTKIRNAIDTGWEEAGGGGGGSSGYSGYSGINGTGSVYTGTLAEGDLDPITGIGTVVHGLGTRTPVVAIYDNLYNLVIPDAVNNSNTSTSLITLNSFRPLTGTWSVRIAS